MHFSETIERARSGDVSATDELCRQYYPRVQAIVHRSLSREFRPGKPWLTAMFSTGDVVQEVFQSVLRDIDEFAGANENSFVAFLTSMVKHRIIDAVRFHEALRRDQRRARQSIDSLGCVLEPPAPAGATDPAELAKQNEDMQVVIRVLSTFPARDRILLQERLEHSRTFAALAEQLGFGTEDAARKAFYAAQARLLVRLRAAGCGGAE